MNDEPKTEKPRYWNVKKSLIAAAIAVVLVIGTLALTGMFTPASNTAAYVAIEINPGVVLEIDRQENVKSVAYANDDAKVLLAGVDLSGTNSINALGTICSLAKREGYLGDSIKNIITLIRFSDKNDKEKYYADAQAKIEEVLGFGINLNTQGGSIEEGKAYVKFKSEKPVAQTDASQAPQDEPAPSPSSTVAPPPPSPSPSTPPSTSPALPAADHAGTGDVMFDIYDTEAVADITGDGTQDTISFAAASSSSTLTVNGVAYTIGIENLAQKFAITDVDISDSWLEIAFCDAYHLPDHDLDHPFTYYYWWNGSTFIECASLWDMGWDGIWRTDFDATDNMDGHGLLMMLDRSQNFTDIWYTSHWVLDGADRQQKEDLYAASPLFSVEPLTLKEPCLLLAHIDLDYFAPSAASMWDHASWPHVDGRTIDPGGTGDVVIIAQPGETLEVVKIYGKRWFKLRTSDGYEGWIRIVDFKMSGYDDVMYIDAWDIFDNIVVAG